MGQTALKRIELVILTGVILLGAGLRLYRISSYMTFLGDEGRDALVVRDILLGKNFPLIGPGTSVGNMYLGPLYYYLISPALLLTHFSPVGPAIFVALIGLLTIGMVWFVSREWGIGPFPALGVAALYAVSPTVITYSRSSWNPNIMPFFALLCIYGIWRVWRSPELAEGQKSDWKWLVVTSISFAFVLNSHYLGLLLAPTLGLFWWLSREKSLPLSLFSLSLLLLLLSPLAMFDFKHNWTNFNALKTFLIDRQQTVNLKPYKSFPNIWPIWVDINSTLLTADNKQLGTISAVVIPVSVALVFLYQMSRKRLSPELILVLSWIGVGLIGLGLYKQHIYTHYFGFLFPAPFLLIGLVTKGLKPLLLGLSLGGIFLLILLSLANHPFRHEPNNQLSRTRQVAEFITDQAAGLPFNLALVSNHNYDASYRYFLAVGNSPYYSIQAKHTDQLFVICEVKDCIPINHPLYEIAAFGWAKVADTWSFPWDIKVYRLIPNPSGT